MKKLVCICALILACFLTGTRIACAIPPTTAYSAALKVDPVIWQYRSRVQAQGLVSQHIGDAKAIYYLINQSYRSNLEGPIAVDLLDRLRKSGGDRKLTIMAAYATVQAAGDGSRGMWGGGTSEASGLVPKRGFIFNLVTADTIRGLNDPYLLVMAAVVMNENMSTAVDSHGKPWVARQWSPLLATVRKAMRLAPKWADAHFWQARLLFHYHDMLRIPNEAKSHVLVSARSELNTAISLDPGMKGNCYFQLTFVSERLNQPKEALAYFKLADTLLPAGSGISRSQKKRTIDRLEDEIKAMKTA